MKKMLVTYNAMRGIPMGRYENGNMIAYSGDYGRSKYQAVQFMFGVADYKQADRDALRVIKGLKNDLAEDLDKVNEVYVYIGITGMEGQMDLCRDLQKAGKKVHLVACDCHKSRKKLFAKQLGLTLIDAECGGRETCARLVRELAGETSATPAS